MKKKLLKKTTKPTFEEEELLWKKGFKYVVGIDEVGRGAFAGPLVAAGVIFPQGFNPDFEINDSKLVPEKRRLEIDKKIKQAAICCSIGKASIKYINKHGISKANQRAFLSVINNLKVKPQHVLIDAFRIKKLNNDMQTPIIHGDRLSISIAAASIVAKVHRDRVMISLHKKHSEYGFLTNKGYGTREHREALKRHGLCKHHRTGFSLAKYLQ
jgi:ribonuclease HII